MQEEKLARIHAANPDPVPEAELEDSAVITAPSEEEQAEERLLVGLSWKQHYAQYVQAAVELGEDMPLGEDTAKAQTDTVSKPMVYSFSSNCCGCVLSCLFPIVELFLFIGSLFVGN